MTPHLSSPELFLTLLTLTLIIALVAQRTHLPVPIALVTGGMALALIPGAPDVPLDPEYVFLLFLPPLLMEAAYHTSLRDFQRNIRPISQLAVGLVIATTFATAWVVKLLAPAIPWAAAIALGAIISPPDAVAATSITRRLRVPKRIVTILEGESLVNDATGLVLYKFAVAAAVTGAFSFAQASASFVWAAVAGCAVGAGIAMLFIRLFPRIGDHTIETAATFIVPYAAYLAAESLHASGVLAVVASGLAVSWHAPRVFTPEFRIRANAVWEMVVFALNGFVFILIGLQFPGLLERLAHYPPLRLLAYAAAVCVTAILLRLVWTFLVGYGTRLLIPSIRRRDPYPPWQNMFIIGWTGMRGVVSLAAALSLPFVTGSGAPFPERDLLIFLAFSTIIGTLVLQGISLPWIIGKMRLFFDTSNLYETWLARKQSAEAALSRLDALCAARSVPEPVVRRVRAHYEDRLAELGDGPNSRIALAAREEGDNGEESQMSAERRLWHDLIAIEREVIIRLRRARDISDDVMREIEQELDLLHTRFQPAASARAA